MSDGLRDPKLPPGAVVEVDDVGTAFRNDGKQLKPAAKNPWYVLATIAGVQEGTFEQYEVDEDLAARNRRYWNGWACAQVSDEDRAALADRLDLPVEDLSPLDPDETRKVEKEFRNRLGPDVAIPAPSETIDFRETHFPHTRVWGKCVFPADAWFGSATFSGDARFDSATFSGEAWFGSATFSGEAWFGSATFSGEAGFESATFSGTAWFDSATFSGDASFDSATFSGYASFDSATFSGHAWFGSATFSGHAWFESATFSRGADFSNEVFDAQTVFRAAQFLGRVPKFYQRAFHQDTTFTTRDGYWPVITDKTAEEAKQAYTRLRQVMNDLQKPDDEHFFFRQEMRCKARLEGRFYRVVSKGFEVVSDYGHSIGRPLVGMAWVIFGIFWMYIPSFLEKTVGDFGPIPFAIAGLKALGLSLANMFAFLGFQRVYFGEFLQDADSVMKFLSGSQTVLGFVLLFFLGLGLRNRFRLK